MKALCQAVCENPTDLFEIYPIELTLKIKIYL